MLKDAVFIAGPYSASETVRRNRAVGPVRCRAALIWGDAMTNALERRILMRLLDHVFENGAWPLISEFRHQDIDRRKEMDALERTRLIERAKGERYILAPLGLKALHADSRVEGVLDSIDAIALDLRYRCRASGGGEVAVDAEKLYDSGRRHRTEDKLALFYLVRSEFGRLSHRPDHEGFIASVAVDEMVLDVPPARLGLERLGLRRDAPSHPTWLAEVEPCVEILPAIPDCWTAVERSGNATHLWQREHRAKTARVQALLEFAKASLSTASCSEWLPQMVVEANRYRISQHVAEKAKLLALLESLRDLCRATLDGLLADKSHMEQKLAFLWCVDRLDRDPNRSGVSENGLELCATFDRDFVKNWVAWALRHRLVARHRITEDDDTAGLAPTDEGRTRLASFCTPKVDIDFIQSLGSESESPLERPRTDTWGHIKQEYRSTRSGLGKGLSFITDRRMKCAVLRDIASAVACLEHEQWKASTILAGGVVEAVLGELLDARYTSEQVRSEMRKQCPTKRAGGPTKLDEMIKVADGLHATSASVTKLLGAVRDWRNLVHIREEVKSRMTPDRNIATAAVGAIFILIRNLAQHRRLSPTA